MVVSRCVCLILFISVWFRIYSLDLFTYFLSSLGQISFSLSLSLFDVPSLVDVDFPPDCLLCVSVCRAMRVCVRVCVCTYIDVEADEVPKQRQLLHLNHVVRRAARLAAPGSRRQKSPVSGKNSYLFSFVISSQTNWQLQINFENTMHV
jgi:hypothetical protein